MFYLCYLSLYFLLAFSSQTSEWMASEYVRNSWQYDAVFITCDRIRCLVPQFLGRWPNCPRFCWKMWRCRHLERCRNQMVQHFKTGKYSFKRWIITLHFGDNCASLPLPISKEAWQTQTSSFQSVTIALHVLSFARWRHYRADSALLWRMT